MERKLSDLEQLLRDARPRPDAQFVRDLEASLLRAAEPRRARRRWPTLRQGRAVVGLALTVGLLLAALSVAGLQGFGLRRTPDAGAGDQRVCVTVHEWRLVRQPVLVVDRDRRLAVRYRSELAKVPRIRCR